MLMVGAFFLLEKVSFDGKKKEHTYTYRPESKKKFCIDTAGL